MKFLDGQTLKHLIGKPRPLELETLLSLAIEIADVLADTRRFSSGEAKPAE